MGSQQPFLDSASRFRSNKRMTPRRADQFRRLLGPNFGRGLWPNP